MRKSRVLSAVLALALVAALIVPASAAPAAGGSSVALGGSHGAAVGADGTLYTWGNSDNGQIGDELTITRLSPVKILKNAVAVAVGDTRQVRSGSYEGKLGGHTLALLGDGTLWTWGENSQGQLGDGTRTKRNQPVQVLENVSYIAAGNGFSFAIKTDGTLWAWGSNDFGQLGDGTRTERLQPVKIMDDVRMVAAGAEHTLAIDTKGTLWTWGSNANGQLGDHSRIDSNLPIEIMSDVAFVAAGGDNSAAVKTNGELWTWGSNVYGQIGNDTRTDRLAPVKIMDGVNTVAVGGTIQVHTVAVLDDQGNPVLDGQNNPVYQSISVKVGHMLALKADGTVWSWGYNTYGQLGDGTRIDRNRPKQVLEGVAEINASGLMSTAIKADGTLWTWGNNAYGQLGDGTRTDRISPVKILSGIGGATGNAAPDAVPTKQTVYVNGTKVSFDAYNIGGANYFKLRDLAMALKDTSKKFSVTFDSATATVGIGMGGTYNPVGGELAAGSGKPAYTQISTHKVVIDGKTVTPSAYNIGGANYFKLRDFMKLIDVYVGYDAKTNTVTIDTSKGYAN